MSWREFNIDFEFAANHVPLSGAGEDLFEDISDERN